MPGSCSSVPPTRLRPPNPHHQPAPRSQRSTGLALSLLKKNRGRPPRAGGPKREKRPPSFLPEPPSPPVITLQSCDPRCPTGPQCHQVNVSLRPSDICSSLDARHTFLPPDPPSVFSHRRSCPRDEPPPGSRPAVPQLSALILHYHFPSRLGCSPRRHNQATCLPSPSRMSPELI